MAETWRVTRSKRLIASVIDFLGRPLAPLLSPRPQDAGIHRILVLEPWYIGDLVLATPVLRGLREMFPAAHIAVLGKSHAREILQHSGLADEVIVFDFPWTAKTRKYNLRRYDVAGFRRFLDEMRSRSFDVTIDARMDLRSNIFTFLTRARRRIGFEFGGGTFLLTDRVPASPQDNHRVEDWLALLAPLGGTAARLSASDAGRTWEPLLRVTEEEKRDALGRLRALGFSPEDMVVGIHGGAGDPRRQWPMENFVRVGQELAERYGARVLVFRDPAVENSSFISPFPSVQTTLRELMALLACCDILLCNDSGPMHVADALDVPVVSVFLTGNPAWHRPYRKFQKVVGTGTGHDFRVPPTEEEVLAAAIDQLSARVPASR